MPIVKNSASGISTHLLSLVLGRVPHCRSSFLTGSSETPGGASGAWGGGGRPRNGICLPPTFYVGFWRIFQGWGNFHSKKKFKKNPLHYHTMPFGPRVPERGSLIPIWILPTMFHSILLCSSGNPSQRGEAYSPFWGCGPGGHVAFAYLFGYVVSIVAGHYQTW